MEDDRYGDAGLRLLFAIQEACPEAGIASGLLLGAEVLLREYKKKAMADENWEKAIRIFADDLYAAGKALREKEESRECGKKIQVIATNLHRLCQIMKGEKPLPAPGARLGGEDA